MGIRSPGKTSPIRGRTMKEYEEQLSQLKKENFNLKLRIYFLEERMGHMNGQDDKEDPVKKNIELKVSQDYDYVDQFRVEAESLRKEVSDKQELLCQAAKAMDLIEEQHRGELKKIQEERDIEKEQMESKIKELENVKYLQEAQQEAERVDIRCQGLELELKQRDGKLEDLLQELEQRGQDLAGCNLRIRTLEEALSAKEPEIQIKIQELCERDRIIEEKQNQIEQQNKVLVEIQITLDEKQRQIEALRASLAARDSTIADIEGRLAKAKAYARNLEAKLDASLHESNRLREERLWAEVEDKNKKLAQLTKERDSVSLEMEKQVQALIKSLKEKEELLAEYENKASTSLNDVELRDNRIKELEEDLRKLKNELKSVTLMGPNVEGKEDEEKSIENFEINNKTSSQSENLALELENNKREVERLNSELQKRTTNLQELVNKELWDKNREIEKLKDRLNAICERKELEVMSLQQQVGARDFQLKMLQDKVTELGMHVNLPTSLMFRELQQIPVTFNQHVHYSQTSGDILRPDSNDIPLGEVAVATTVCTSKDDESSLREQLQASLEERKYLCRKVEELRERLRNTPERDSDSRTLRNECVKMREEIDKANIWRKEAGEAYLLVTKRLEELAGFLSSLLRHPEQLGSLGAKRRQLLKQAVERNVELSRSLSVSFSINSQDLNNITFAPLMDSFSSLLMSANDLNFSITDILRLEEDECEVSSCEPEHQDIPNETGSHYCRSSGSNSEIAQILGMKDSTTSEDIFSSTDKIVGEQAQVIAQLRSQIEILNQEIKQRDIEFSRSQNERITCSKAETPIALPGPRSGGTSPSKSSSASSGTVWKRTRKGERLEDVIEAQESLNSMIFYNSHHVNKSVDDQPNSESVASGDKAVLNDATFVLDSTLLLNPEKSTTNALEAPRPGSSPIKNNDSLADINTLVPDTRSTPRKQDQIKNTKSSNSYKMYRSCSASAVTLNQLQQPVQYEIPPGSHSESEAWSEPDRTVSLARIGLNEESSKSLLSSVGVNGCPSVTSTRSRNARTVLEDVNSSESSEETAHEIRIHSTGKRSRSDSGEVKRLQNRLRAMEQVNQALRAELTILHQLTPPALPTPSMDTNDKPTTCDISINTMQISEDKHDKSTSIESQINDSSSVTVPTHLLEQIRYQREKLESSLFHNDFIRRQLESIISSLSSEDNDNMMNLCHKMKETTEQLEEARHQSQELEQRLQEMEKQLEQSKEQARLASAAKDELQTTRQTVSILQEQVTKLEARINEKDNEILESKCQLLELENKAKHQSMESEKAMQEAKRLKDEAEVQLKFAENLRFTEECRMQEAEKVIKEAEKIKSDADDKVSLIEKRLKDNELEIQNVEALRNLIDSEREEVKKERNILNENRESVQKEKETNEKEKIKLQEEWERLAKEKESMKIEFDICMREVKILTENANKQKDEAEKQIKEAGKKIQEAELCKEEAEWKIKAAEEEIMLVKKNAEDVIEERTRELENQLDRKLQEAEKKLEQQEWVNKSEERESELKKRLQESEKRCREKECELMKRLDETTLTTSQASLERIRLANEKLRLEQEIRRHEARETELVRPDSTSSLTHVKVGGTCPGSVSSELDIITGEGSSLPNSPWGITGPMSLEYTANQNQNEDRERIRRGSDSGHSGGLTALSSLTCSSSYWVTTLTEQHSTPSGSGTADPSSIRNINSSPDLGIESDQGRFSSLEAASCGMQMDATKVVSTMEEYGSDLDHTLAPVVINSRGDTSVRSYKELEQENMVLKRRLTRTNRALEETQAQLTAANQRKKQVERAICKQLHKTHHILKKARINLDAGSDYISPSTEEVE
ncbi:hypothetical protein C0J52_19185 [Blattella germanica]|nr:hypothetical protein C0J52_19185 [Blattella germanica]